MRPSSGKKETLLIFFSSSFGRPLLCSTGHNELLWGGAEEKRMKCQNVSIFNELAFCHYL
jgi:hypothetical protein